MEEIRRAPRGADDESILAEIRSVNLYCEEQDRIYKSSKFEESRMAQERELSESKRENLSVQTGDKSVKEEMEGQSSRRREDSIKSVSMYYNRHHHKNKRLEILNRYHYNPFE